MYGHTSVSNHDPVGPDDHQHAHNDDKTVEHLLEHLDNSGALYCLVGHQTTPVYEDTGHLEWVTLQVLLCFQDILILYAFIFFFVIVILLLGLKAEAKKPNFPCTTATTSLTKFFLRIL